MWRALNTFTKGSQSHSADIPKNLTADKFNNHFLSVAECLAKPRSDDVYDSECSNILHEFFINPKKTHSMTIATRQKHQLLLLSFDLLLHGVKVE